jgi:hypothetical protein
MFSCRMYCQISSSVQFDSGKTRIDSPDAMRVLNIFHISGRWFFGSHTCWALRKEKMRSLARDFSSSRRAPPKAASKPVFVERLAQRHGLHDMGVGVRTMVERIDVVAHAVFVDMCTRRSKPSFCAI